MSWPRAVADTSVFIGLEAQRFDPGLFTETEWAVSTVTLGELMLGVFRGKEPDVMGRRMGTFLLARRFQPLPVNQEVYEAWGLLASRLRAAGRRVPINDSWIAATALAHKVPVVTQDSDYDDMPGLEVIKI